MNNRVKILFLIHDLGQGGAEKVLINLVNNMDQNRFDITITALFGGGVNEQFLSPRVKYNYIWKKAYPGNSRIMKLLSPKQLHNMCVKEVYDIEVSYLEGPSARIIAGCPNMETRRYCWIHSNHFSMEEVTKPFRNEKEAKRCYTSFDKIICVSQYIKENFCQWIPVREKCRVLYNAVESNVILKKSKEDAPEIVQDGSIKLVAAGTLKEVKGFERLLHIIKQLVGDGEKVHLYLLGKGPLEKELKNYIKNNRLEKYVTMLGYQINPYKYVAKSDIFVCSSYSEGFSTAVTEALIVGTAICTVDVSGMNEMLGENNEYGIVTENSEEGLYQGLKVLLNDKEKLEKYKQKAYIRGKIFSVVKTVNETQKMFEEDMEKK